DRIVGHRLSQIVVLAKGVGELAVTKHSNAEAIDVADSPVIVRLEHHVGIVAFGEGVERLGNYACVAQIKQATVSIVRVDDRPVVGVVDVVPKPAEALEFLPISHNALGRFFKVEFANSVAHVRSPSEGEWLSGEVAGA